MSTDSPSDEKSSTVVVTVASCLAMSGRPLART